MRTIKLKTLRDKAEENGHDPVVQAAAFSEIIVANLPPNGGPSTAAQRLGNIATALANYRERSLPSYSYREAILAILAAPLEGGLGIDRLRSLDRLYGLFEAASDGDVVSLEDVEYEVLKSKLADVQFTGYNRYLIRFVDDIEGAPVLDLNEKKPKKEGKDAHE